jgi:plasmid stabilization system protein ParE
VRHYRVEFSPAADRHAERIQDWWVENRQKSPGLFRREVAVAIRQLSRAPETGRLYNGGEVPSMRRLLLPRTRHYIYFTIDEPARLVRVHAVWHASRGTGPV